MFLGKGLHYLHLPSSTSQGISYCCLLPTPWRSQLFTVLNPHGEYPHGEHSWHSPLWGSGWCILGIAAKLLVSSSSPIGKLPSSSFTQASWERCHHLHCSQWGGSMACHGAIQRWIWKHNQPWKMGPTLALAPKEKGRNEKENVPLPQKEVREEQLCHGLHTGTRDVSWGCHLP